MEYLANNLPSNRAFTYNLISPKIVKAAYNRKNNKNKTAILDQYKQLKSIKESCTRG